MILSFLTEDREADSSFIKIDNFQLNAICCGDLSKNIACFLKTSFWL
jgi:hypothetical protein